MHLCHDRDLQQPSPCIPESSTPFLSPQAHSQIQHLFLTMSEYSRPNRAQPDHLYLSLVSSSSLSLASSHMLPLPLFYSLRLTSVRRSSPRTAKRPRTRPDWTDLGLDRSPGPTLVLSGPVLVLKVLWDVKDQSRPVLAPN